MFSTNQSIEAVLLLEFSGQQSLEDHQLVIAQWDKKLLQEQPFIAIRIYHDAQSLIHSQGIGKLTRAWLKDSAAIKIQHLVSAMINIVPGASYDAMKHMSVEAVFKVPGGIFKDTDDAIAWLQSNVDVCNKHDIAIEHIVQALNASAESEQLI